MISKSCNRNGCGGQGVQLILNGNCYLCSECWQELLNYRSAWPAVLTTRQVENNIRDFVESAQHLGKQLNGYEAVEAEFRRLTGQE